MTLRVPSPADFHVHLRQGELCHLVAKHVKQGGYRLAYVMPNLTPPITTTDQAVQYRKTLEKIEPDVKFLMTLYLSPGLTPGEIEKAHVAGIAGVKSYPRGVTTNSESGIESYEQYYPVFEAMERLDMVLNLHGELPSQPSNNICVMNAEEAFLPQLKVLHARFPKLRIVLEHATSRAAVDMVKSLGDTIACTITAHHLALTVDDWAGQSFHYCKPVAKFPDDRLALQEVIKSGHPRFFLGSDSAPHPVLAKSAAAPQQGCAAGIFTSPILLPLVAHLLESFGALNRLSDFTSNFGRRFYGEVGEDPNGVEFAVLRNAKSLGGYKVPTNWSFGQDGVEVVPFWAGKALNWEFVGFEW